MARDGEIQNVSLLQRAADFLNIGGVHRRVPVFLNRDQVQAVYEIGPGQAPEFFSLQREAMQIPAGGAGFSFNVFGSTLENVFGQMFENSAFDCWLVGLTLTLNYDAAGALADNGRQINLNLQRYSHVGSLNGIDVITMRPWDIIATGFLKYYFVLGGQYNFQGGTAATSLIRPDMTSYYIPRGDRLQVILTRNIGTWPANTVVDIVAHIFTRTRLPQTP